MKGKDDGERSELARILGLMTLSDGRVAAELDVSAATVRSWRTGRRKPSPENRRQLVAAARYHAFTILRLAQQVEGAEAGASDGDGSVAADPGELEETGGLLAREG